MENQEKNSFSMLDILIVTAFYYLLISYVNMDFNIFNWSNETRLLQVVLVVISLSLKRNK
jgi:hypothetical protein